MAKQIANKAGEVIETLEQQQALKQLETVAAEIRSLADTQASLQQRHEKILKIRSQIEEIILQDKYDLTSTANIIERMATKITGDFCSVDALTSNLSCNKNRDDALIMFQQLGIKANTRAGEYGIAFNNKGYGPEDSSAYFVIPSITMPKGWGLKSAEAKKADLDKIWAQRDAEEIAKDGPAVEAATERAVYLKKILTDVTAKESSQERS